MLRLQILTNRHGFKNMTKLTFFYIFLACNVFLFLQEILMSDTVCMCPHLCSAWFFLNNVDWVSFRMRLTVSLYWPWLSGTLSFHWSHKQAHGFILQLQGFLFWFFFFFTLSKW